MSRARLATHEIELPWSARREDRKRLRGWLTAMMLLVLVLGLPMPWLPVPEVEREELEALPPQLARIVMEKPKPPPPPPPPPKEEEPEPEEPQEPEEVPEPEPEKPEPEPQVADVEEKARTSGLLAFQDAFADMRAAVDVDKLTDTGAIQQGAGEAASIDRSLLTSKHSTRSSGVNTSALSKDTGGVALSGRSTTKVEAPEQQVGDGGTQQVAATGANTRERSIEEVRRVFDANKGAIFAIYNRALRSDPTLQGKVVLELVIDPSGRVIDVMVVASELADQIVIDKIVNRIRLFNFGKRDVERTTISYPVHFLPS